MRHPVDDEVRAAARHLGVAIHGVVERKVRTHAPVEELGLDAELFGLDGLRRETERTDGAAREEGGGVFAVHQDVAVRLVVHAGREGGFGLLEAERRVRRAGDRAVGARAGEHAAGAEPPMLLVLGDTTAADDVYLRGDVDLALEIGRVGVGDRRRILHEAKEDRRHHGREPEVRREAGQAAVVGVGVEVDRAGGERQQLRIVVELRLGADLVVLSVAVPLIAREIGAHRLLPPLRERHGGIEDLRVGQEERQPEIEPGLRVESLRCRRIFQAAQPRDGRGAVRRCAAIAGDVLQRQIVRELQRRGQAVPVGAQEAPLRPRVVGCIRPLLVRIEQDRAEAPAARGLRRDDAREQAAGQRVGVDRVRDARFGRIVAVGAIELVDHAEIVARLELHGSENVLEIAAAQIFRRSANAEIVEWIGVVERGARAEIAHVAASLVVHVGEIRAERSELRRVQGDPGAELPIVADRDLAARAELPGGIARHDTDRARRRVAAEQRALRPAQHLDALEIGQIENRSAIAADVDAVEIERDFAILARRGRAGEHAAHREGG